MLSHTLSKQVKIFEICRKSPKIRPGDTFSGVIVSDDDLDFNFKTTVICCGKINRDEMLFKTEDGRYYFSLTGGWGTEKGILYGIETEFCFDFKHPTDPSALEQECQNALGTYSTWGGAMAYSFRKNRLETIKKVCCGK